MIKIQPYNNEGVAHGSIEINKIPDVSDEMYMMFRYSSSSSGARFKVADLINALIELGLISSDTKIL